MHGASIVFVTPALAAANNGNWQTAQRWARMLRAPAPAGGPGHRVRLTQDWRPTDAQAGRDGLMVALHARRSAAAIQAWKQDRPAAPLLLVLTGTDLYRDIDSDASAQRSLVLADALVVLNRLGLQRLPPAAAAKALVILQSAPARTPRAAKPTRFLRALMVGHLREEKDPACLMRAAERLALRSDIRIDHIGGALDVGLAEAARALDARRIGYRWLGALGHAETRRRIRDAHVLVHASRMEGGAHVVIEALRAGTPVLASRMDGNLGLLGLDWPAQFEVGDDQALAAWLQRLRDQPAMLAALAAQARALAPDFAPEAEAQALHALVATLARRHDAAPHLCPKDPDDERSRSRRGPARG